MDPDDVFSVSFEVGTSNLEIGSNYSISFSVSFKQDENYYETPSVSSSFTILEPTEKGVDGLTVLLVVIIVIVIIVLLVLYSKSRKRRLGR
jgi:hypothetical protein